MKRLLPIALLLALAGCVHAQQPVTTYEINYSADYPTTGCNGAAVGCSIEFSDAPQVAGACPTVISTIACTTAIGATTCSHTNAPTGTTVCAVAQTVQGGITSAATAPILVVVPALPGVPTNPTGAIAVSPVAMVEHVPSNEQLALNKDGSLRVTHKVQVKVDLGQL
jgi:hypothetical protein